MPYCFALVRSAQRCILVDTGFADEATYQRLTAKYGRTQWAPPTEVLRRVEFLTRSCGDGRRQRRHGVLGDTPTLIAVSQGLQARQQGSYLDRYAQGILLDKGLLSQVKLVAMLSAQATPAFEAGSLDAMLIQPPTRTSAASGTPCASSPCGTRTRTPARTTPGPPPRPRPPW